MDHLFFLDEQGRAAFFQLLGRALGCTYICLWSFFPAQPSNFLVCKDGWWNESSNQPSSSSSSSSTIVQSLFNAYRGSVFNIESGGVPGLVSKGGLPYLELKDTQILSLASTREQEEFYQRAAIKIVAFLRCKAGEIELGTSTSRHTSWQVDIMNLFSELLQQTQTQQAQLGELGQNDQSKPSSSSSSFISLSMGSPEYSSLLFNMQTTYTPDSQLVETPSSTSPLLVSPHQLTVQSYAARNQNTRLMPVAASRDDAEMTRAMLAVISSQQQAQAQQAKVRQREGAFRPYLSALRPVTETMAGTRRGLSLIRRAISFLRSIPMARGEVPLQHIRPTPNQLHHMISERKRREKLNDYFQALRKLLPPGTKKKDKASVLASTIESLGSLSNQIMELKEKNKQLEQQLVPTEEASEGIGSANERVQVQITAGSEASSEERRVQLQVVVREDVCNVMDLVSCLLKYMKQMNDVTVTSIEASTQLRQTDSFSRATIRLVIKTNDWNEQSFKEGMTKAVEDEAR